MTTGSGVGGQRDPLAPHASTAAELKSLLAVERDGRPFLVYRDGAGQLETYVLPTRHAPVMVGRRQGVDLRIAWDAETSGVHAELRCLGGEWTVADDGLSTNGTFVNTRRVAGRQRLRDGDRIQVGRTALVFNAAISAPTVDTTVGQDQPHVDELSPGQRNVLIALCRPQLTGGTFRAPASNQEIAKEVFLSVDAVKRHLRTMFAKYGLDELPQNQKRAALAELASRFGLVSSRDV